MLALLVPTGETVSIEGVDNLFQHAEKRLFQATIVGFTLRGFPYEEWKKLEVENRRADDR